MIPRPGGVRIVGSPLVVLAAVTGFVVAFTGILLDLAGLTSRAITGGILVGMLTLILSVFLGFAGTGVLGMKLGAWVLAFLAASGIIAYSGWGVLQPGPASIGLILVLAFTGLVAAYLLIVRKQFGRPAIDARTVSETNPLKLNPTRLIVFEHYVIWVVLWFLSAIAFLAPTNAFVDWQLFEFRLQTYFGVLLLFLGVIALVSSRGRATKSEFPDDSRIMNRFMWIVLWFLSAIAFLAPTNAFVDRQLFEFRLQTVLGALLGFLGVIAFVYAEVKRITIGYTITDSRVFKREGIIRRDIDEMPLSKVERIELKQGFKQRMLRYGTIELDSGEEDDQRLKLESLESPKFLREMLSELARKASARIAPAAAPAVPGAAPRYGYAVRQPAAVTSPATPYGSPPPARASPVMGVPPSPPTPSSLREPPVNPPAPAPWAAAEAEVQNLEKQVREDRDFLFKLDKSLVEGRIDNATYSEIKRSRTDHIAGLERRIAERTRRGPHL